MGSGTVGRIAPSGEPACHFPIVGLPPRILFPKVPRTNRHASQQFDAEGESPQSGIARRYKTSPHKNQGKHQE